MQDKYTKGRFLHWLPLSVSPTVLLESACFFLEYVVLYHLFACIFFIHFPKPVLSRAAVSSFNQFSKSRSTPSRTVGNGHCNNNNTKSNLNYALKRLGQNNPQNKHKWGGGPLVIKCREESCVARVWMFLFLMVGFV